MSTERSLDMNIKLIDLKNRVLIDYKTLAVILIMCLGFIATTWAVHVGHLHFLLGLLIGSYLMNLSFTAWHESSHSNFSTSAWLNDISGIVASGFSTYPGYFARRREHLIHHKWEGQPGKDPVYLRIQDTNFWKFPFRLIALTTYRRAENKIEIPDNFFPITTSQQWIDRLTMLAVLGTIVASVVYGFWWALLWCWIVPRVVIFFLHAYYICFFPHALPEGGYQLFRVRQGGWWRLMTVDQNYHGIHHKWPFIPWHKYKFTMNHLRQDIDKASIEVL